MKVGIDISSVVFGTGVSDYTRELVSHLKPLLGESLKTFGFSLRRRQEDFFPFPPTFMDFLCNRLHIINIETFVGPLDVYHSSDWTQAPSIAKKVTTIHDLSPFLYPSETYPKIVAVHTRRMKWVVSECDKIICVSQNTADDMRRLFPSTSSRLVVIPEALPSRFLLEPRTSNLEPYVFAIGARQPRKNISRLKQACKLLGQKLIIVGEGSDLGHVTDQELVDYLANASAFVYPSLYEGFGLPILEAFHFQVPVACSNTSSFPEVAENAASYFDPTSVESIAAGIKSALTNKAKLISAGTKQLAKFNWQDTAKKTLSVYESL